MAESHRMMSPRKILVNELNTCLTCTLCGGYFIDATTVVDCSHTFCRACIVRHFESSRLCPSCGNLVHKSKPLSKLRSDTTLQSLVYKVVPSLYSKELQRRADFYHSTGFRANSSCSDDSVLGDRTQDNEEWVVSNIGDPSLYFSPDDSISLSVEYYSKEDSELEPKPEDETDPPVLPLTSSTSLVNSTTPNNNNNNSNSPETLKPETINTNSDTVSDKSVTNNENHAISETSVTDVSGDAASEALGSDSGMIVSGLTHKRFLQCPAAVRMSHLMKFLRMKFALSNEHRVDIIYAGEVLAPYLSLMDVAYTFKWNREKPMRFFYLIYIPIIRPVVPQQQQPEVTTPAVSPPPPPLPPPIPPLKIEIPNNKLELKPEVVMSPTDTSKVSKKHKEIKIKEVVDDGKKEDNNNLNVSPKTKPEKSPNPEIKIVQKTVKFIDNYTNNIEYKIKNDDIVKNTSAENCVYEYAEPDKDEIKAFAERRDREWALQKYPEVHVSKKRKKSKHSKSEFMHKKRKLHAEITSNEVLSNTDDSLKLKVKFSVANGHKHKHRSSSNASSSSVATVEPIKPQELSHKERLLQMRQVRHKQVSTPNVDDKPKTAFQEPNLKIVITSEKPPEKPEPPRTQEKPENSPKVDQKAPEIFSTGKTLRSDFSNKTSLSKDICNKYVRVSLEKVTEKLSPLKKSAVNNFTVTKASEKDDSKSRNIDGKTEIIPIENKIVDNNKNSNNSNNKLSDATLSIKPTDNKSNGSKILDNKVCTNKILDNKIIKIPAKPTDVRNSLTITENKNIEHKIASKPLEHKLNSKSVDQKLSFKPVENKIVNKSLETKVLPNKTSEQTKMAPKTVGSKLLSPKPVPKTNEQKSPIDESKAIENKLNNIDFKSTQSSTLKNFTVSKVETGTKRKLETPEIATDKRPSLEITVINLVTRPPQTSAVQTNPVVSKPISNSQTKTVSNSPDGPPAKKIRPPPLTIPLGRIQKMNNINKANMQKPPEKCDIFGALDLSAKPTNKPELKTNEFRAHSASPKPKIQDQIQSMIRPKTPIKTGLDVRTDPSKSHSSEKRPNISNLQLLSESAVQIRELMVKGSPISTIPNLIKKVPSSVTQNSGPKNSDYVQKNPNFQQKTQNLIPKTSPSMPPKNLSNFAAKTPIFMSKNLQKLPKLNEINKGQFGRLNSGQQVRPPRPAGQNQTVRNIPNPSLLVRQQNQNRINSLNNSKPINVYDSETKTKNTPAENTETEKRPENKTSEPPPLKPIELFKK